MLHIHNIVHRIHCVPACNFAIVPKSFVTFDVPTKRHFTNYANNTVFVLDDFKRKSFIYYNSLYSYFNITTRGYGLI